jgi:PBP1b-binding outer membrane lipoprotein LpoB
MKKFKILIFINLILVVLSSCATVKEGFKNQKKNGSDEFLVEKKSPLVMPPDFDNLPSPDNQDKEINLKKNGFKNLISKNKNTNSSEDINNNLEGSILKKIKNN